MREQSHITFQQWLKMYPETKNQAKAFIKNLPTEEKYWYCYACDGKGSVPYEKGGIVVVDCEDCDGEGMWFKEDYTLDNVLKRMYQKQLERDKKKLECWAVNQ